MQSQSVLIVHLKSTACAYQKVFLVLPVRPCTWGFDQRTPLISVGCPSVKLPTCPASVLISLSTVLLQVSVGGLSYVGRRDSVGRRLWAGLMMAFGKCRYRVFVEGQRAICGRVSVNSETQVLMILSVGFLIGNAARARHWRCRITVFVRGTSGG